MERFYPIGTPGTPWAAEDKAAWFKAQSIRRSYADEVRAAVDALPAEFERVHYGALPIDPVRYPLVALRGPHVQGAPAALITGGVHGYETSGVQGALRFLARDGLRYAERINLFVAPCVSPWGYEVIHRWNPDALDPNRSFIANSPAAESAALMELVAGQSFLLHIDLHETTDTDESEFRPALAARDGKAYEPGTIPDGFYLVEDTQNPQPAFQRAILDRVAEVTHIAAADPQGKIIGEAITQPGVIRYPFRALGLCAGMSDATYTTTTEVYPDSAQANDALCNEAQAAAIAAALDFALDRTGLAQP